MIKKIVLNIYSNIIKYVFQIQHFRFNLAKIKAFSTPELKS